jgi:uncharacterized membrane protein YkoI
MSQKTALITAAAIAAFLLVLVGGVFAMVAAPTVAAQSASVTTSATAVDVQALQQREQQYQQLLAEANQRLQEAYATQTVVAPAASNSLYAVTPDLAVTIALNVAPGSALLQTPSLVELQSAAAYEVTLDTGLVYVDANSGQVLYNGTQAAQNFFLFGGDHEQHEQGEGGGG